MIWKPNFRSAWDSPRRISSCGATIRMGREAPWGIVADYSGSQLRTATSRNGGPVGARAERALIVGAGVPGPNEVIEDVPWIRLSWVRRREVRDVGRDAPPAAQEIAGILGTHEIVDDPGSALPGRLRPGEDRGVRQKQADHFGGRTP